MRGQTSALNFCTCKNTSNTANFKIKFDYYQYLLYLCGTIHAVK